MKEFNPKVSIVIPVYNGSNFLSQAIDSALAQTYKNIEVVVVNDGSTDGGATDKIARSYGSKIQYFQKENGGVATALNFGIQNMKGAYFSWLSHDDMYETTKIEEQVNILRQEGADVVVACNTRILFPNGIKKNEYIDSVTFAFTDIFLSTSAVTGINGCALLIPRKVLIESGGFDVSLPVTQDYDLWFRLKDRCRFILLEKNLVISRRHDKQDSVQKQKLCLEAGDKLHYAFLNDVPYDRFEMFFSNNSKNLETYWNNYNVYKVSGFHKTAAMMLKHLLWYYYKHDDKRFSEILASEVGTTAEPGMMSKQKQKKRILFYSNVWHRGGIERVLSHIFTRFCDEYDCILVTNQEDASQSKGFSLPGNVQHIRINNRNHVAELIDLISLLDIDLFVGNPNYSPSFIDIYPLLAETNTKSIAYNHGHYFLPYMCGGYLYPTAIKSKEALRAANYVVWLSQTGCNLYNIENDNGLYIANPVSINRHNKPRTSAKKNVLAVGRFEDEIKRIDKTLLVFRELYKIDSEYHLDIVGNCPMDDALACLGNMTLRNFIAEQAIPVSNITFWGEQADVSKFYDNADFLVLTSRCEGFALVLVEALSRGVPCAVLEYLGVDEIVQDGHNGWVCEEYDFYGLASNISKSVSDKQLYAKLSQNALSSVTKFDEKIFYEKWNKLLTSILYPRENGRLLALRPKSKLTSTELTKVATEYEKLLNIAAENYLLSMNNHSPSRSRIRSIGKRLITSLSQDGVYVTTEKSVRKVLAKMRSPR